MKLYMIGHEKCDLLIQVTACAGLTVSDNLNKKAIRLFQIISIPSARQRDFDGMLGTGLLVSMYTTKSPIDMWYFNVPQLKEFLAFFVKDKYQLNYSICITDNYFFKIKFAFFLYLLLSAS